MSVDNTDSIMHFKRTYSQHNNLETPNERSREKHPKGIIKQQPRNLFFTVYRYFYLPRLDIDSNRPCSTSDERGTEWWMERVGGGIDYSESEENEQGEG